MKTRDMKTREQNTGAASGPGRLALLRDGQLRRRMCELAGAANLMERLGMDAGGTRRELEACRAELSKRRGEGRP